MSSVTAMAEPKISATVRRAWGEKVAIVLHHLPNDESCEGGYETVTMAGMLTNFR
jgi:hypothetical protein